MDPRKIVIRNPKRYNVTAQRWADPYNLRYMNKLLIAW